MVEKKESESAEPSKEADSANVAVQEKDKWWVLLGEKDRDQTFSALLKEYSPTPLSWADARRLINTGKTFLDDGRLADPAKRYQGGKRLEVRMSEPKRVATGELDSQRIQHVDKHIVVVDKPAGLVTVYYSDESLETLEILLRGALQRIRKGRAQDSLYVVHRLDKLSSGLLVFARSKRAHKDLQRQFTAHTVKREYIALVHGRPEPGTFRSWLCEDRGDGYKGSVPESEAEAKDAKEAITHIQILEKFNTTTLISCRLETGRTHQIRIQLSEAGHPLVGDIVYLKACFKRGLDFPEEPDFNRVALHAKTLSFVHPVTEEVLEYTSPTPKDIQQLLKQLRLSEKNTARPEHTTEKTHSRAARNEPTEMPSPSRKPKSAFSETRTSTRKPKSTFSENKTSARKPKSSSDDARGRSSDAKRPARRDDDASFDAKRPARRDEGSKDARRPTRRDEGSRDSRRPARRDDDASFDAKRPARRDEGSADSRRPTRRDEGASSDSKRPTRGPKTSSDSKRPARGPKTSSSSRRPARRDEGAASDARRANPRSEGDTRRPTRRDEAAADSRRPTRGDEAPSSDSKRPTRGPKTSSDSKRPARTPKAPSEGQGTTPPEPKAPFVRGKSSAPKSSPKKTEGAPAAPKSSSRGPKSNSSGPKKSSQGPKKNSRSNSGPSKSSSSRPKSTRNQSSKKPAKK